MSNEGTMGKADPRKPLPAYVRVDELENILRQEDQADRNPCEDCAFLLHKMLQKKSCRVGMFRVMPLVVADGFMTNI